MRGGGQRGVSPRGGWKNEKITQQKPMGLERKAGGIDGCFVGQRCRPRGWGTERGVLSEAGPLRCDVCRRREYSPSLTLSLAASRPLYSRRKTPAPILSLFLSFVFCVSLIPFSCLFPSLSSQICSAFFDRGNSLLYLALSSHSVEGARDEEAAAEWQGLFSFFVFGVCVQRHLMGVLPEKTQPGPGTRLRDNSERTAGSTNNLIFSLFDSVAGLPICEIPLWEGGRRSAHSRGRSSPTAASRRARGRRTTTGEDDAFENARISRADSFIRVSRTPARSLIDRLSSVCSVRRATRARRGAVREVPWRWWRET